MKGNHQMTRGSYKPKALEIARRAESYLQKQNGGIRLNCLAKILDVIPGNLYNAIANSYSICEDDSGKLYYVNWKQRNLPE